MMNSKSVYLLLLIILLCWIMHGCKKNDLSGAECATTISYSSDIAPIVSQVCAKSGCHANGSPNGDYSKYEGLKAKADNGTLKEKIVDSKQMPKTGSLTDDQRILFKCWIEQGSPKN